MGSVWLSYEMSGRKRSFPGPWGRERRWKNRLSENRPNYSKWKETNPGPRGRDTSELFDFDLHYPTGKQDSKIIIHAFQGAVI